MAKRRVAFVCGEYYHVYNRGVDKRVIFGSKKEYQRFMTYLVALNCELPVRSDNFFAYSNRVPADFIDQRVNPLVAIGAYCLMPNHFHLLVTPLQENGVEKFMQRLGTAYTMYFNSQHERSGSLFQGTYKSVHADNDRYLKYLYSYITLNPVPNRLSGNEALESATEYPYSSAHEFREQKFEICEPQHFPKHFTSNAAWNKELLDWILYKEG